VCWTLSGLRTRVVEGALYDAGPLAGRRGRALQLEDSRTGATSCAIEPASD
jgi:hypothetical protein